MWSMQQEPRLHSTPIQMVYKSQETREDFKGDLPVQRGVDWIQV